MENQILYLAIICILGGIATRIVWRLGVRTSEDVLTDLNHDANNIDQSGMSKIKRSGVGENGLSKKSVLYEKLYPLVFGIIFVSARFYFPNANPVTLIIFCVTGLSVGYLIGRYRLKLRQENYLRSMEFYLPMVMERLVMAVQAGLDVIPALSAITRVQNNEEPDPVTKLLKTVLQLTESGLSFDQSLTHVANGVECRAVKHAFLHLSVAHKEGGELIMPLRELSDATQLYFQESREEEIARLPVKATLPLLCTFAGLILCFITSPLIQVISLLTKATLK